MFTVNLSYQGQTLSLPDISTSTTGTHFYQLARQALYLLIPPEEDVTLKLLLKGKKIPHDDDVNPVFTKTPSANKSPPKVLVMASAETSVQELNAKKQDPTMRGFDQEKTKNSTTFHTNVHWGPDISKPDKNYKFGRLQECSFHEFGHRPTDSTPHAFKAKQLLERLSTDPGVISILQERELNVGTLGEMDPIDDRIMQKEQKSGACLLGYNTNRGLRIDVKLRTDDLSGFRPYFELVSTVIHELSHNWVGEHNALFWANYGQMRVEYFMAHKRLQYLRYQGQTSAQLADIPPAILQDIVGFCMMELQKEMVQHHLDARTIAEPIQQRYQELESSVGIRLGGTQQQTDTTNSADKRNLVLEASSRTTGQSRKATGKRK